MEYIKYIIYAMKLHKVMAVPILLRGRETWLPTQKCINSIHSEEIKFLRRVKGC